ncbi:glycoside hydrolase family 3 C-terminal domain-containing protein [Lachnospiraceae bacterium ASD4241]|uniref:Glycoside hydrolase family 3 C-terminal domain-containing protein n=2 Tax=Diplocloster modestus TaxID=2850322 RepID=A0ABS6K6R5_9FIRM|nr:glycoside hydrolase family 3 C-terminal domain-containing protein [Diplocloster modestus]
MEMTREERLKYTEKAENLVSRMTLEEKVFLMSGGQSLQKITEAKRAGFHFNYTPFSAGGNKRLQVPDLRYCDGPRGVVCGEGKATCFPVPMLRGATFDVELEEEIGRAIGREARAFGANLFGGVCINLPYHPGWGRSQEVYGEDSFAMGAMGSALVRGVQSQHVIACLKHYAFNSMENSRFEVDINCDKRTEREVYLSHFKDCIDAGAAAVMTAYNKYKGEICGHSGYLLRRVLKEEWSFDGFVISDFFWGITDTAEAANAGMDVEMCHTRYYGKQLIRAVNAGQVKQEVIDEAAVRIVRTLLATDQSGKESGSACAEEVVGCEEHAKLALRAAQEGITLIKNERNILPLSRKAKRIAVIGKLASKANTGDTGSSEVYPAYVVTILEGIVEAAVDSEVYFYDGDDMEHMKRLAEKTDVVIFTVGLDYRDEGEFDPIKESNTKRVTRGGDRKNLGLHAQDVEMLKTVGAVNQNSVAVLMGGSTITVSEWEPYIPAILYAYYPGQEGGTAVAQILFGDVNPSGKLPFVLPKEEADLPEINWDAKSQRYHYYHGYRLLEKNNKIPYRPYGFGMSYTTFELSGEQFRRSGEQIEASVMIKNTGEMAGSEVLQLYAVFQNSCIDRPVKTLCGFKRVMLQPGEARRVEISCPIERLKYYNEEQERFELEHMDYEIYIGTSSAAEDLQRGVISL